MWRLGLVVVLLTGCAALEPPPGTPEGQTVMTCFYGYTVGNYPFDKQDHNP